MTVPPTSPARILVVDDEPSIRTMLRFALNDAGFVTAIAESAEHATEILSVEAFAVLVVDKNLPGMSGVDLIRKVREKSAVPIVLMTAFGSAESAAETLNLGIETYIEKPFPSIHAVPELVLQILAKQKPGWVPAESFVLPRLADPGRLLHVLVATSDKGLPSRLGTLRRAQVHVLATMADVHEAIRDGGVNLVVIDVASFSVGAADIAKELRALAPSLACAVITDPLTLGELKTLIDLGVVCLLNRDLDSVASRERIRSLVDSLKLAPVT